MKIFLVEDSDMILARLRGLVSEIGGAEVVAEADSQESAIAGISAACPDVAILDLTLASGSGMEVLRHVKEQHPEIKAIVLTNRSEVPYRKRCMALGADLFLDKSRDIESLKLHLKVLSSTLRT